LAIARGSRKLNEPFGLFAAWLLGAQLSVSSQDVPLAMKTRTLPFSSR